MAPLNLYLARADDAQRAHALARVRRRDPRARGGQHLRRRPAVQEFRRDALRPGRVLRLRRDRIPHRLHVPPDSARRRPGYDEMSGDVWYPVGPHDVFPEEFATFLLTDPRTRESLHLSPRRPADARNGGRPRRRDIRTGRLVEVLSYPDDAAVSRARSEPAARPVTRATPGTRLVDHKFPVRRAGVTDPRVHAPSSAAAPILAATTSGDVIAAALRLGGLGNVHERVRSVPDRARTVVDAHGRADARGATLRP